MDRLMMSPTLEILPILEFQINNNFLRNNLKAPEIKPSAQGSSCPDAM